MVFKSNYTLYAQCKWLYVLNYTYSIELYTYNLGTHSYTCIIIHFMSSENFVMSLYKN